VTLSDTRQSTQAQAWPKRRMHHLFAADGKAVMVAMDHSRMGNARGLEDMPAAVARVISGGADALLVSPGTARAAAAAIGRAGVIVALDSEGTSADWGVDMAVRMGADAVELKVFPGNPTETKLLELRRLAAKCFEWGMPLLAEPIPVSFQETTAHTVENVGKAARIGAEAGADMVKVHYVGTPADYKQGVTDQCYVPVLVLGGSPTGNPRDALQMAANAMEAGARGVVFGRNVIQHERPDRMVAALAQLVHGGSTVDQAAKELNPPR
jgi:DhnA family fructose-bisphosphate aldolase class Ia